MTDTIDTEIELNENGFPKGIDADIVAKAPRIKLSRRGLIKGLAAGTVFPIASACTTNPVTGAQQLIIPGFDNASLARMSQAAWSDMKSQTPQVRDRGLTNRVLEVWGRTAQGRSTALANVYNVNAPYNPSDWEVAVFDTKDVNAFVMPGQQVGVFKGLIDLSENNDQLSCVLGHEAGHIDGRHSAERASLQVASQAAMVAGSIAIASSEELSKYGNQIVALGGAALQFGVLLPYSRRHELEADRLGVDFMHAGGYDVTQSVRLWQLMDAQSKGKRPPEFMSTHPDPGRRAAELAKYINARGYALI